MATKYPRYRAWHNGKLVFDDEFTDYNKLLDFLKDMFGDTSECRIEIRMSEDCPWEPLED